MIVVNATIVTATTEPPRPLGLLIAGARRSIKQAATRRLGRRRLSAQQFWLLIALHEQPCPSLRELAERRLMDSPTASRMVEVLVRRGLVRIEGCPEDRRRRTVALTEKGAALARELRPLALELREAIQAGFSEREAETFRADAAAGDRQRGASREEGSGGGRFAARPQGGRNEPLDVSRRPYWPGSRPRAVRRRARPSAAPAVPVVAEPAARKTVALRLHAIGNVEAIDTVAVRPQVGGQIVGVHFREGTDVKAGDALFTIDPRPYEAALHQAEATLARDEANARNARLEAQRSESLFEQGVLSREQYDALHNSAEALDATVRAERAGVESARLDLGYCDIRSPIDGRAGSLLVQRGNVVKAIDGGPLVVINRVDPVFVSFSLPERQLGSVTDGPRRRPASRWRRSWPGRRLGLSPASSPSSTTPSTARRGRSASRARSRTRSGGSGRASSSR